MDDRGRNDPDNKEGRGECEVLADACDRPGIRRRLGIRFRILPRVARFIWLSQADPASLFARRPGRLRREGIALS